MSVTVGSYCNKKVWCASLCLFYNLVVQNAAPLQVGDHVLLPEYGGTKVTVEEKEYHIFREADILGKFDR